MDQSSFSFGAAAAEYGFSIATPSEQLQAFDQLVHTLFKGDPENAYAGVHLLLPDGYQHPLASRTRIVDEIISTDRTLSHIPVEQSTCFQLLTHPDLDYLDTIDSCGPQTLRYRGCIIKNEQGHAVGTICVLRSNTEQGPQESTRVKFLLTQLAQLASIELTKQKNKKPASIVVNASYSSCCHVGPVTFAHLDATNGLKSLTDAESKHFLSLLQGLVDSELEKGKGAEFQSGSGVWVIEFDSIKDAVAFSLSLLDKMHCAHFDATIQEPWKLARIGIYGNCTNEPEVIAIQAAEVSSKAKAGEVLVGSAFSNGLQTIPDWGTGITATYTGLTEIGGVSEMVSIFSCSWEQQDAKWRRLSMRRESTRLERKRSVQLLRQSFLALRKSQRTLSPSGASRRTLTTHC